MAALWAVARIAALALLATQANGSTRVASLGNPNKYLIASSPATGMVYYTKIPEGTVPVPSDGMKILLTNLSQPQGLAVDLGRKRLIIAAPPNIITYQLSSGDGGTLVAKSGKVLVENTESRWVAVDAQGAVYFTSETANTIMKVPFGQTGLTAITVYDGSIEPTVNAPAGLALDTFAILWVNKALGTKVGSVVSGPTPRVNNQTQLRQLSLAGTDTPKPLAANSDKSYGICKATSNIFYTQPESTIYGIQQQNVGGEPLIITDRLTNPRGCVFDGDGTVYVADRGANAIFSFAGNQQTLSYAAVTKTADVEDAFAVAVFSRAPPQTAVMGLLVAAISLVFFLV